MTIQLHQFPTALGMPNLSPFCMKVENWLRLAGLPYEIRWQPDPRKGPVGKLPFVVVDGETLCDSERIIARLSQKHGIDLDAGLSAEQRAVSHAFGRMLDEHTYWALVHARWIDPAVWRRFRRVFFGALPLPVRGLVATIAQRQVRRDLRSQGIGRHPEADLYARLAADLASLSALLGDQPFFFGEQPTKLDATAYAFLGNIWEAQLDTAAKPLLGVHTNLVAYCSRMRERCYGESASKPAQPPKKNKK